MRGWVMVLSVLLCLPAPPARADEEGDRILSGVVSGLLGQPAAAPDAAYAAKERERLASLLQSGEYATSRQGEAVDLMVLGVPLTHRDHVYSARPIPPSSSAHR